MASVTLARAYQSSFNSHPNATLALAGGSLNALGDGIAQVSQNVLDKDKKSKGWDVVRTFRFFCFGCTISPIIGRWNILLERWFPFRIQQGATPSFGALSKRVAADQLLMAPLGLAFFIGSMGVMEGNDYTHIQEKYRDMYKPALITNWQFINFRFMPLAYRVPFQQTCGVFWTLYLSIINSREDQKQELEDAMRKTVQ